jgi:hypothetical protein
MGDARFLATYADASRQEDEAHRLLEPLARRLGGGVFEHLVVMRTLSERWHEEVTVEETSRDRQSSPSSLARIPIEQELYEAARGRRDRGGGRHGAAWQRARAEERRPVRDARPTGRGRGRPPGRRRREGRARLPDFLVH